MNTAYLKEHLTDTPAHEIDFVNFLERACIAFDISFRNSERQLISMDELFEQITVAYMKYQRELGNISFK